MLDCNSAAGECSVLSGRLIISKEGVGWVCSIASLVMELNKSYAPFSSVVPVHPYHLQNLAMPPGKFGVGVV